jgi:hypothetical protein
MAHQEKTAEQGDDLEKRLLALLVQHGVLPKEAAGSPAGGAETGAAKV